MQTMTASAGPPKSRLATMVLLCLTACSQGGGLAEDLHCEFVKPATRQCTEQPSMQGGTLELEDDGEFELEADYEACFDKRRVTAEGRYQVQSFPAGKNIELLAENMSGAGADSGVFPRTVGSLDLELTSLKGVYTDLWVMKSRRTLRPNGTGTRIFVICKK